MGRRRPILTGHTEPILALHILTGGSRSAHRQSQTQAKEDQQRAQLRKLPGPSLPKGLEYLIESSHGDGESDMPELVDFQDDDSDED